MTLQTASLQNRELCDQHSLCQTLASQSQQYRNSAFLSGRIAIVGLRDSLVRNGKCRKS